MSTELTPAQSVFVDRLTILNALETYPDQDPDIIAATSRASRDLENARSIMEEQAAFPLIMEHVSAMPEHAEATRTERQKAARAMATDPETRFQYAEEAGVYASMGYEGVPS